MDASRPSASRPAVEISTSAGFTGWLREHDVSLALTTYQTHRLLLLGTKPDGSLSAFERLFDRPMGLASRGGRLWMATRHQLWRFDDVLEDHETRDGYDRVYVPHAAHTTGELDLHDLALDGDDQPLFVATRYGCLATLDPTHSFRPVWRPPFLSAIVPEDRCHLNGLAMEHGRPRYVTAVSQSDVAAGWRERRADGGVVVDVDSGHVVADGLSMPHSPRIGPDGLWVLDSGNGQLLCLGTEVGAPSASRDEVAFLPGFARGLALVGDAAIVGLSLPRGSRLFEGLPLQDALASRDAVPRCGLVLIERATGRTLHWLSFHGVIRELYDVVALENTACPTALGIKDDATRRQVSFMHEEKTIHHVLGREPTPTDHLVPTPGLPDASGDLHYAVHEATLSDVNETFEAQLPRRLLRRARDGELAASLRLVTAERDRQTVGFGLAQALGTSAEVLHIWVAGPLRRNGVGTELLVRLGRALANQDGAQTASALFRRSAAEAAPGLLRASGWPPPRPARVLFRTDVGTVEATGQLDATLLPSGYCAVPWRDLNERHRRALKATREDAPAVLDPLQVSNRRNDDVSLALLHDENVIGWVVVHQAGPETLQITSLWLAPEVRQRRLTLPLLAALIRQMREGDAHRAVFMVDAANEPMLALTRGLLAPFVEEADELWAARMPLVVQ